MSSMNNSSINTSINISQDNVQGNCDLKCSYNFKYSESNVVATNKQYYIQLTYDNTSGQTIIYNNNSYNVSNIKIYSPSIHIFNSTNANAEIVIGHTPVSGGENLYVCVPLVSSSSSQSLISDIINAVSSNANQPGQSTNLTFTVNLENIVPIKPFFSYTNTNKIGQGDYIVFGINDAIQVNETTLNSLSNMISQFPMSTPGEMLFYNLNGPNSSSSGASGDIYISCQPTGTSTDEVAVGYVKPDVSYDLSSSGALQVIQFIIGCIIFIATIFLLNYLYKYFTSKKTTKEIISNLQKSVKSNVNK